ncbi:MAG: NADH:flavin oxidoreductase [Rhabdochlamydiaceae bacterium]|jgi:2,4-dienoyl-CoA reductase-like NADH-dependent reductase (Old Yellow Enzyme family)
MKTLLSPFRIHSLELSNRIVMAPMTRNKCKEHIPGTDVAKYYRRRAEGGVGLIITEGTVIDHKAAHAYPGVPSFYGKEALEGWQKVVEEVHEAKGKIFPQLWHVGSVRQTHFTHNSGVDNPRGECCYETKVPGYAPSPIPHPYVEGAEIPHEMSKKDILEVIEAFAKAALTAKKLRFDGVEIHGAHGYLIDQFFWDYTNKRTDEYGGSTLAERTRFAVEVIQAVRKAVGNDFPIDFRFSQWKMGDYNAKLARTPKELESFLLPLANAGVDIFHCSTRRFWEPEFTGSSLNLAGWTKKITGKATITVGSVGLDADFVTTMSKHSSPHQTLDKMNLLLNSFDRGEFDLIAVGRALLADPAWLQKIAGGRFNEIIAFSKEKLDNLL